MVRRHPITSVATFAYLGVVCWLTLNPAINTPEASWLWRLYVALEGWGPTSWVSFDEVEFVVNVLIFAPVGVLFVLLLGRSLWWAAIVFGIIGSCWIELAQYLWLTERTADSRDVVSNGIGMVIGVFVAMVVTRPSRVRSVAATSAQQAEAVPSP
jgi:glycopeptide antibiotics resistance protein